MKTARVTILVLSSIMLLAVSTRAAAQDQGSAGISMGYPASVGFVFHVSERFALRPHVDFSRSTTDVESPFGDLGSETSTVEVGVSGLFVVGRWDKLRAYVSPGYSYRRTDRSSETPPPFGEATTFTLTGHTLSGSFGAQYSLHERFSVFGEAGLQYLFQEARSGLSTIDNGTTTIGTRTAIGVIFYF
jgi:hypothetical protein